MNMHLAPTRYARPPSPASIGSAKPDFGADARRPDTSRDATLRRVLVGTLVIVLLGVAAHFAAAISLTLSGLVGITLAGFGAMLVGEANLRTHPRLRVPRGGDRAARRNRPDRPAVHPGRG